MARIKNNKEEESCNPFILLFLVIPSR